MERYTGLRRHDIVARIEAAYRDISRLLTVRVRPGGLALLNNEPVPVVMTVTVNFTPQVR